MQNLSNYFVSSGKRKTTVVKVYGRPDPDLQARRDREAKREVRKPFAGDVSTSTKPMTRA